MGWATEYIARLQMGETVTFRPTGRSMEPLIMNGALCTVAPFAQGDESELRVGDIVLCRVRGSEYLHLVKGVFGIDFLEFQIGNNRGGTNGWIGPMEIYGRLVKTEP